MSNKEQSADRWERWYRLLTNDEDVRACKDISSQACREVPGSFLLTLMVLVLSKTADLLSSPKVALSWLMSSAGVPAGIVVLLSPIRESGSLIPQLALGSWVRRQPRRRGLWCLGSALQALTMAAVAGSALLFEGLLAGVCVMVFLSLFSLSRGLCSIAMKDVQGKTIPKGRRGRLSGWAATVSGALGLIVASYLVLRGQSSYPLEAMALIGGAVICWLLAAALFMRIAEEPGETEGGASALAEAWSSLSLLKTDKHFRRFVTARALLMGPVLGMSLIVLSAQQAGGSLATLGGLLMATALAGLLSASFWGYQADRSSRWVMAIAGCVAAIACASSGISLWMRPELAASGWVAVLVFVLALGHAGIRIGRKTYLLDLASGGDSANQRIDYVAVSNSVIGVLLLLLGGFVALLTEYSLPLALLLLGVNGLLGAALSGSLKSV